MEQQQEIIQNQQVEIDTLKTEVAKLKKLPPKPKIRSSKLPKDDDSRKNITDEDKLLQVAESVEELSMAMDCFKLSGGTARVH